MLHLLSPHRHGSAQPGFRRRRCAARSTNGSSQSGRSKEQRLKAAIVVPGEDAAAAVAEIEHWAGNPDFAQVSMVDAHDRADGPAALLADLSRRRRAHGLPIGLHTSRLQRPRGRPATGWSSYYVEEHHEVAMSQQALATSLVCEGVFERVSRH